MTTEEIMDDERSRDAASLASHATPPEPSAGSNAAPQLQPKGSVALAVVAFAAVVAVLYFGKMVFGTLIFAVLLTFVLEPLVGRLERWRVPRPVGALFAFVLLFGSFYAMSYFFYVKAEGFVQELPKYSGEIKNSIAKFRKQTQKLEQTRQQMMPDNPSDKKAVTVKSPDSGWSGLAARSTASITEFFAGLSFIPFLSFFMLTWQDHLRASAVKLFPAENRTSAYVAVSRIGRMLRAFITGNLLIGLIASGMSLVAFWLLGIPYFYFIGFISGFLSLVPYLGVVLAIVPPAAAGVGVLGLKGFVLVAVTVLVVHLISLNVFYPKVLGSRVQLNPLVVTVSLLVWGFLWGAVGLLLAIPITAALKIVCDHIESLQALGELMGENNGAETSQ